MIEGGAGVLREFLTAGAVDELQLVVAPRLVGGGPAVHRRARTRCRTSSRPGPSASDVLLRYRFGAPDDRHLAEACVLAERCPPSRARSASGASWSPTTGPCSAPGWSRRRRPARPRRGGRPARTWRRSAAARRDALQLARTLRAAGVAAGLVRDADRARGGGPGRLRLAGAAGVRRDPVGRRAARRAGVETVRLPRWEPLARRCAPRSREAIRPRGRRVGFGWRLCVRFRVRHGNAHSRAVGSNGARCPPRRRHHQRRRQERAGGRDLPVAAPPGRRRRAVQGPEHEQQLRRHHRRRGDRAGAGAAGRGVRPGAERRVQPGAAQAGLGPHQPGRRPRPRRRHGHRAVLPGAQGRAARRGHDDAGASCGRATTS